PSIEYLDIYGEGGALLQSNLTSTFGDCGGWNPTVTITIPQAQLMAWAADGTVTIQAQAPSGVSTNVCNCSLGGSMAFEVEATLEYPGVTGPNDAGVSALVSPTLPACAG